MDCQNFQVPSSQKRNCISQKTSLSHFPFRGKDKTDEIAPFLLLPVSALCAPQPSHLQRWSKAFDFSVLDTSSLIYLFFFSFSPD